MNPVAELETTQQEIANKVEKHTVRLLVVDDEQAVLESYRQVVAAASHKLPSQAHLRENDLDGERAVTVDCSFDFDLMLCEQGDEAVEAVRRSIQEGRPFAAAFIDVRMPPGPDGVWTAERIRVLDPYLYIVMVTAYHDYNPENIAHRIPPADRLLYIQKPFHVVEIQRFVWALSTRWRAEKLSRRMQTQLEVTNKQLKRDIRARKQAEEALEVSEEKYRNLTEKLKDVIIQISPQGIIQYVSPAVKRFAGYDPEEGVGKSVTEYIPESHRARVMAEIKQAAQTNEASDIEFGMLTRQGDEIPVEVSTFPIIEEGKVVAFQCVLRDITERKQAEEKVRAERDKAQRYLDVAGVMVTVIDADEKVRLMNRTGCEILGYSEEEIIGQNWFDALVPQRLRKEVRAVFEQLMAGEVEPVEYYENPLLTKAGEERIIAFHNTVLRDENGGIYAVLSSGEDITERKQAEEERKALQQQLFQAQKLESLGTLVGGVAHDFNNLLTGIIGMAELALKHTEPDSQAHQYLVKVPEQGRRAADLIGSLLAFSRRSVSERRPLALLPLVKETYRVLERTIPENIRVGLVWPDQLPSVNADPTQIQQVIMNLATNARDAMPDGGQLTLQLAQVSLDEQYCQHYADASPGDYVCLSVRDTGSGMPPEVQEHIFEPFFTTKDPGEGTGLGLAMVYGIVKNHAGYIHVYSEVDRGTEFRVYLPLGDGRMSESNEDAPKFPVGGSETLLLVEDDAIVLSTGQGMLESFGYHVLTATDGEEGLKVYRAHHEEIALVLTDMTMPKMGGDQLYQAIRDINPTAKVLLVSGYSVKEQIADLEAKGLKGSVQKPFDLQALGQKVRDAIDE